LLLPLWVRELAAVEGERIFSGSLTPYFGMTAMSIAQPSEPLHVAQYVALRAFRRVLGLPRRIFLLASTADQEATASSLTPCTTRNTRAIPTRRETPEVRDFTCLAAMGFMDVQRSAPSVLRHASLLFDLPQPPIYNVCADSAGGFPRIVRPVSPTGFE
jgi:hypothetical protein